MLTHPRPSDLAGDAVGILGRAEVEQQDEVPVVDLGDAGGETARSSTFSTACRNASIVASPTGSRK